MLQCVAMFCHVLQYTSDVEEVEGAVAEVCCSVLQRVAVCPIAVCVQESDAAEVEMSEAAGSDVAATAAVACASAVAADAAAVACASVVAVVAASVACVSVVAVVAVAVASVASVASS